MSISLLKLSKSLKDIIREEFPNYRVEYYTCIKNLPLKLDILNKNKKVVKTIKYDEILLQK